jgi:DNA-binding phage protein
LLPILQRLSDVRVEGNRLTVERVAELRDRVNAGEKKAAVARDFGISRETLYSYL